MAQVGSLRVDASYFKNRQIGQEYHPGREEGNVYAQANHVFLASQLNIACEPLSIVSKEAVLDRRRVDLYNLPQNRLVCFKTISTSCTVISCIQLNITFHLFRYIARGYE